MRAIDADALISEIKKDTEKAIEQDDIVGSFWLGYIAGLVIKQPSIQPEQCGDKSYTLWKESYEELKRRMDELTSCSDIISRQAAIDALDFEIVHMTAYCDGKNEGNPLAQYNKGLEDGKKAIEALPSVQPEPQEGYWIRTDCGLDVECKCSKCGYRDFVAPRDEYWFKRNYCPNCGAKMKGDDKK